MKKNKTILLFGCMLAMVLCVSAQQSQSNGNTSNAKQTKVQFEAKNQAAIQQAPDAALIYEAQHKKSNSTLPSKTSGKKATNLQPNKNPKGNM